VKLKSRISSVIRVFVQGALALSLTAGIAWATPLDGQGPGFEGTTYYVSPGGDDSNPGTSEDDAFRVVQHAIDQMAPGDTLIVMDGLYAGTLRLKSGIRIKARNPRRAIFSGVEVLGAKFEPHSNGIYRARIESTPKQLFYNGQPMTWAQWPNLQWSENWEAAKKWVPAADGTGPGVLTSEAFKDIENLDISGGYCFIRYGKGNSCYSRQIESFDGTTLRWNDKNFYSSRFTGEDGRKGYGERLANMTKAHHNHPISSLFFLAGDLDLLDAPGEWFADGSSLYFYPPGGEDPSDGIVLLNTIDYCVDEERKITGLTIEGIDFFACSVKLADARNNGIVFENVHFSYPGAELLFVDRVQGTLASKPIHIEGSNIRIEQSLFAGAQNTALYLRGAGITVENSVFMENNRHGNFESRAVTLLATGVYRITRNTFFNNHSDAILVRSNEYSGEPGKAEVSWNNIFNGGKYNTDVSGIYMPTGSQHYAEVHHNWIHNVNGQAFRLDLAGRRLSLHHNVFWGSMRGMSVEGYGEFNIYNNTDVHNEIPSDLIRNVLNHSDATDASKDLSFPPIEDWNVLNNIVEKFNDRVGPREKITHNKQKKKGLLHPERDASWLIPITERGDMKGNLTGEQREIFTNGELSGLNLIPTDPAVENGVIQTGELASESVTALGSYRGAYDVNDEYWYPGSDWMPYGLEVLRTMARADKFAKDHLSVSIVPRVEISGLSAGKLNDG